ncbi:hypothetical protein D3C73_1641360 [compost metagenome]
MGALISVFNTDFSKQVFGSGSAMQLWYVFVPVYAAVSVLLLWLSVHYLRPVYRKR